MRAFGRPIQLHNNETINLREQQKEIMTQDFVPSDRNKVNKAVRNKSHRKHHSATTTRLASGSSRKKY